MQKNVEMTRQIYTISQLNEAAKAILEDHFPLIWIEGELSNFARPSSGHCYFSLKDQHAQVRCAMFQMRARSLTFKPENGMQVLVRAQVSLYSGRGDFQLIVEHMELAGDGVLQRAYEELKQRLAAEQLFLTQHKKKLPSMPQCIGVITSPTGAAIQDILSVLSRRAPMIPVIIYPTAVQGQQAAPQIVEALRIANERQECDVLILARGGGSLEDLWAFNEESVARAIFSSELPIVSAVGHEIDFTIADFVADVRAPTPSVAAELVSPDTQEWFVLLEKSLQKLQKTLAFFLADKQKECLWLSKRLRHPGQRLQEQAQHLDHAEQRLLGLQVQLMQKKQAMLHVLFTHFVACHPQSHLNVLALQLQHETQALYQAVKTTLSQATQTLAQYSVSLDNISPLATLKRGYALVTCVKTGEILMRSSQINKGERISIRLAEGECLALTE